MIVIQIAGLSLHLHPLKKLSTFSIRKQSPITTIEVIMTQKIKIAILTDHIPLAAIWILQSLQPISLKAQFTPTQTQQNKKIQIKIKIDRSKVSIKFNLLQFFNRKPEFSIEITNWIKQKTIQTTSHSLYIVYLMLLQLFVVLFK